MNLLNIYTTQAPVTKETSQSFKSNSQQNYKDPLRRWPLKGLAYSNELGAVVSGISPKLGTALWVPALMYFGADIYDKYKNEETSYNPSAKRGVKEAVFQAMASVVLPTVAVHSGQKAISALNVFTKDGLTTQAKQEVIQHSLEYMQSKSLHTFVDDVASYKEGFKNSILTLARDSKGEFQTLSPMKKVLHYINPFAPKDTIAFANEKKLAKYAEKQAETIFKLRGELMQNKKPKNLSNKLFNKFKDVQSEYKKIYPAERYMGKAAKSIIKEHHNSQIFNNKMVKTIGGLIGLALLAKPIDEFVEKIVIKKTVEPGLDYISNGYHSIKNQRDSK